MKKQFKNIIILLALLFPLSAFAANPAVLFVFDGSGSMWGQVEGKTKIELAKEAMSGLLKSFPEGTDIGLVAYGHNKEGDCTDIELLSPLGSSRAEVVKAVNAINPKGKTPLTKSIQFAAEQLKKLDAPTSIVVVSDGKESCNADPCQAAKAITAAGVDLKVHVVGFDVKKDEAEQLQCIAKNGGGKYFSAGNATELAKSFAEVKKEVVVVKPKPVVKKPVARVIFQDEFNDEFLSDQWEVMNPDEDSMIVEDGHLQIITDISKDSYFNPTNFILLNHELKGEYEIILKMKYSRTDASSSWGANQNAGLMLYKDKQNGIVFTGSNNWGGGTWNTDALHFAKLKKGEWMPDFKANFKGAVREREVSLRIQRLKRKFIASYLDNKGQWQTIGEYTELSPKYRIGIFASRGAKAHEDLQKFDVFTLKGIE